MLARARKEEEEEEEPDDDDVLLARTARLATVVQRSGVDVWSVDDERRRDGADAIADTLCAACARAVNAKQRAPLGAVRRRRREQLRARGRGRRRVRLARAQ